MSAFTIFQLQTNYTHTKGGRGESATYKTNLSPEVIIIVIAALTKKSTIVFTSYNNI